MNESEFYSTGTDSSITLPVDFPNKAMVTVRIVDDIGRTAEATVRGVALEGEFEDDTMAAPRNVTAECVNGEIEINWTTARPARAKYLLVRLNDVDLDYVPVEELSVTLDGIENTTNISSIKVAWLDSSLELGEWAEVELVCADPINLEPVETGISVASISLSALGILAIAGICVYKKYLPR